MTLFMAVNIPAQNFLPADHELLLMPTAYTMPEKNSYFSDYELMLLNYSYAVTSSTHLSAFSIFPITTQFYESFSVGFKQKLFTYNSIQTAMYGTYTPKGSTFSIGQVLSVGVPNKSFHCSLAYVKFVEAGKPLWIVMAGLRMDTSENTSLLFEYENATAAYEEGMSGIISVGLRIRSTNMSWEIAGMRPLEDTGDLLFIPLLKVGYYFN